MQYIVKFDKKYEKCVLPPVTTYINKFITSVSKEYYFMKIKHSTVILCYFLGMVSLYLACKRNF